MIILYNGYPMSPMITLVKYCYTLFKHGLLCDVHSLLLFMLELLLMNIGWCIILLRKGSVSLEEKNLDPFNVDL
jgi:hypothetical protein